MLRKSVVILAMLMCSMATQVFALGLGTVTVESALNQPLRVRIEVIQLGDTRLDDVTVQMASLADFQRFNIDRVGFLSNIRFRIEATEQGDFVVLTSNQIVREPYLSFILDTRWPNGRLLSEHTVLLDLPVFSNQNQPSTPVQQPVSPLVRAPEPAPPVLTEPDRTPVPPPEVAAPVTAPEPEPIPESEPESEVVSEPEPAEPEVAPEPELDSEPVASDEPMPSAETDSNTLAAVQDDTTDPDTDAPEQSAVPAAAQADSTDTSVVAEPEEPAGPETIETNPNDTLTDIALQVRPDNSVSLQQTMLAIQRLNPDAFIADNINRLRSGEVLRVPQLTDVQEISASEAISEINRQNQQFADLQPLTSTAAAQQSDSAEPQGELSVVTDTGDSDNGGSVADNAELEELDQRIAELENTLALQQEEADRARLQREEMEARLSELDEQIAAAQEIIRLQDLQLAQLQESLADAAAEAEAQAAAEAAQLAAIAAAEAEARQAARSGGIVDDIMRILTGNTMMMVFAVVLAILLLVVLLLRRNRADKVIPVDELDELAEQEFDAAGDEVSEARVVAAARDELDDREMAEDELDSELDDIISASDDDSDFDLEFDSDSDSDSDDDDVISAAQKLIAANKFGEANAMLRGALDDDPDNSEIRLKLAEVLVKQKDAEGFEEQAVLIASADRSDLDLAVANLREQFTGDAAEVAQEDVETDSFLDDLGIDLETFDDDLDLATPDSNSGSEEPLAGKEPSANKEKDPSAEEPVAADDEDDLDLSFDLSGDDADSIAAPESKNSEHSDDDLNIDLDDEFEIGLDTDNDNDGVPELASGDSKAVDELEIETLDFELDTTDDGSSDTDTDTDTDSAADPEELEIETFEFSADDLSDAESESAQEDTTSDEVTTADENSVAFSFEPDSEDAVEDKAEADSDTQADDIETFDFDLEDTFIEKPESPESKEANATATANENEVSFDLEESSDQEAPSVAETDADADDDFDFDLDEFEIDEAEAAEDPGVDKPSDSTVEDSKGMESASATADIESAEIKDSSDEADDFFDLDAAANVSDGKTDTAEAADGGDDLEDLDFLADDDDLDIGDVELLSDDDEAATKLELAYAYQKMGDADGAREILGEVVKEGNADQVKEAEKLLNAIDQDS